MPYLDQFLQAIVAKGASDLHIGEGQPPKMRRHGDVMAMRPEPVLRDEATDVERNRRSG
jgi:twitching motility protein PilT